MPVRPPRRTRRVGIALVSLALAASGAALGQGSASAAAAAAAPPKPRPVLKDLLSPLSLAVAEDGTAYVAQNFAGQLWMKRPGRKATRIYTASGEGTEVGAVSERRGNLAFATTEADADTFLHRVGNSGKATRVANLSAYEERVNPDGDMVYGAPTLDEECAAQFPEDGPPPSYPGIVESHPYATLLGKKATFVVDAAANAVFKVNGRGRISTLAVLPGAPIEITAELAGMFGLPECAIGHDYAFESVPTDIERGPDGMFYVSSLPGGPEDPALGARGSVFRVNPKTGKATRIVSGLMSPTGLAVSPAGHLYVAELFGMQITRYDIVSGNRRVFAEVPMPGDVEWAKGGLRATVNVMSGMSGEPGDEPAGRLVHFRR